MKLDKIVHAITECKECGESRLSWCTAIQPVNDVPHNRANAHDFRPIFVLGCDYCSETLMVIHADEIAEAMNEDIANAYRA